MLTRFDRMLIGVAPGFAVRRLQARATATMFARHFEAAQSGRRTEGWTRRGTDANAANAAQGALHVLRDHARDLVRNNGWAKRGKQIIANNTVGWGIAPNPIGDANSHAVKRARKLWRAWAESTQCDADGHRTMYGLQRLVLESVAESGEVLVWRRRRPTSARLAIPLQLQVLEIDHLDTGKSVRLPNGHRVIQGIEFDADRRRVAYYVFPEHPGGTLLANSRLASTAVRVPADELLHIYRPDRPGQVRGVTWYAPGIVKLKDFDEYDDAVLLRQKIAACFAAFVTSTDGNVLPVGEPSVSDPTKQMIEPGTVSHIPTGATINFTNPPTVTDATFDERQLRKIAAGLGVTYEDLSGDYSRVNFSSARLARLSHWANVHDWRWNLLIPMFCDPVWQWAIGTAFIAGEIGEIPPAKWTPPPMPMIEPDKEGLAYQRLVRGGVMTPDEMVLEQGGDPEVHWQEYAAALRRLDELGIVLDCDARRTTQAGNPTVPKGAGAQGGKHAGRNAA